MVFRSRVWGTGSPCDGLWLDGGILAKGACKPEERHERGSGGLDLQSLLTIFIEGELLF